MAQPGEFDVEGAEDESGGVTAHAASSEDPPVPPEPEERKPEPPPNVPRIGRPPKNRVPAPPAQGTFGPPNIAVNGEDWPKDISGLWMSCLAWMKKESGGGPERFILWVWQARGATSPSRMPQPIHGEQVAGSEEVSAGEALLELVTDVFHIPSTNDAASYQVEICLRSTGAKVRKSEMFRLDRPEQIHRTRDAMRKRIAEASGGSFQPSPSPRYVAPAAYPQTQGFQPQQPQASAAPPPPPVSGIDYIDRYIDQLQRDKENAERREREREERQKEADEKHAREMAAIRIEMQERFTVVTPPATAAVAAPVESEDAKQAKLAAMVAQSVMQTLIAAGLIGAKPAAPAPVIAAVPPPTQEQQREAVGSVRQARGTLRELLAEFREMDAFRSDMEGFLRPKKDSDDDDTETPTDIHVEPAMTERRTQKYPGIYKGNDIHLAVYDPDDDAPTTMKRIVDFFQLNPTVTSDVIQGVVGVAVAKLADGPLAALIPQLLNMPGAGAVAGSVLRGAVQGVAQAQSPSGGGGAGSA